MSVAGFVVFSSGCALDKITKNLPGPHRPGHIPGHPPVGLPGVTHVPGFGRVHPGSGYAPCLSRYPGNPVLQVKCINAQIRVFKTIFTRMSQHDKGRVTATRNQTIATRQNGTYTNPETGVEVKTKVVETKKENKNVEIAVEKDRVKELPPIELIGKTYKTKGDASVRNGPGKDYKKLESYGKGKKVHVVGKVKDKDWYLVSKDNVANGYIHVSMLEESNDELKVIENKPKKTEKKPKNTTVQTAQAEIECHTVETEVKQGNDIGTESKTYCSGPNGYEVI